MVKKKIVSTNNVNTTVLNASYNDLKQDVYEEKIGSLGNPSVSSVVSSSPFSNSEKYNGVLDYLSNKLGLGGLFSSVSSATGSNSNLGYIDEK